MTLAASTHPTLFPRLSGFAIVEQLYAGSRTRVYRAVEEASQRPVIIKLLQQEYPTFDDLLHFRNQYTIGKALDLPGIVRPYSLEPYGNSYALVMEDFGGISLQEYAQQASLSLFEVLTIAQQLSTILHDLHQQRVIHKDLKPANILIHPDSKQVKLIDFSIASLLPRETQEIQNPKGLEGTLAYLAPEQTGRMNRGIDYRSDFYAFGITLYELLTGQLPFPSEDPMELVHCHLTKFPIAPHEIQPEIPTVVSEIVLKLLAKNAEDRYQSAIGLQHDLQRCLTQLQETGAISAFAIGQHDISDRFLIPEKLYGREAEIQALLAAFDRVAQGHTELMLVAGFSGIGKTAVVNEVHKPIVRQRGYFIKGKFDQFNRNIPFSAFVQAFRDLMGQLLSESDEQLHLWKAQILHALGENAQVMIEVIPELERIIGSQPPAPELSGNAAQNRFHLLLQKFIQVFTTPDHPLVMFLDDLQWIDSVSLNLLKLLVSETSPGYLLILGAYRDNEVFPAHPLMLTLEEIQKAEATVNTITLKPLVETTVNQLVADTLSCTAELAQPLTQWVYQKTQGNPFFMTQFLKALYEEGWIAFQPDLGYWQCDLTSVRQLALTDDVVEFMAQQLQKFPVETQRVLKLAACIGNQFDLKTLAIVAEQSSIETASQLWKALQEGLILPLNQTYKFFQAQDPDAQGKDVTVAYKFLHDRVQQAAYSMIAEDHKQVTHLKIGQLLQHNLSESEQEEKLFDIIGHFNLGHDLLTQPEEREALAQLNLLAGQKARNATAYGASKVYLQTGIDLLPPDCWQSQYELTLNLWVAAAESAYLNGDFEDMEQCVTQVLNSAQTILDRVKIYEIQINALTAQTRMLDAIVVGRDALAQLGIEFSAEADDALTGKVMQSLGEQLQDQPIEGLTHLPIMSDPRTIAAVELLALLASPVFLGNPRLLPLTYSIIVNLSLQFGNAPASTVGYVGYGLVLAGFLGEVEKGYNFGRVAVSLLQQMNLREFQPVISLLFGGFLQHRQEPLKAAISTMKQGYLAGMETGDFLYAGYNASNYFYNNFFAGIRLNDWEPEIEHYCALLAQVKQTSPLVYLRMTEQVVQNLRGMTDHPDVLSGNAYDETVMLDRHRQASEVNTLAIAYVYKIMLAYLFGNYTHALDSINQANSYVMALAGMVFTPIFHFYAGLTQLSHVLEQSDTDRANTLALVKTHHTTLAQWAIHAPMNHQHKVDLIDAEKCRVLGKNYEAGEYYDSAIAGAKTNGYIQEEALANELAAKFYLERGKEKVAAGYMQEAYYCYSHWGAKAKTKHLEQHYPQLLRPILQPVAQSLNVLETLATIATPNSSLHTIADPSQSSSTNVNAVFDFAVILKASQSLSSTIQLDELLRQLTHLILQHSGGDRCAFVRPNSTGTWQVEAIATTTNPQLCAESLEGNLNLPVKLIQYVKNTQEVVVIDGLNTELPVLDEYLHQHQPQSLLGLPVLNQGQLIGILVLENRSTAGIFTNDRILILNFLCTQAAISLENARLYQQAQHYAQQLEHSQLQIVQSEKMASLGNLVAGVAHEINNPIGFLTGSIGNAKDYVQDLLDYIALYQQHHPHASDPVQEKAEDIDLEFLSEDLPKLLDSMKGATDRIKGISTSLRTFSRADTEHKVSTNLHEGIDSTLLILKYRLKANQNRPEIKIVKMYGALPEVECFPGQLNQVMMNILANAIDVFDEMAMAQSFQDLEAHPQCIEIQTAVVENQVEIRIRDNGKGMSEEVKARIFDHLFTTKGVGKGTGLGLAIARQIVEEKHGGKILVNSSLGEGTEFLIQLPA